MDYQVVILAGRTSKSLIPLASKKDCKSTSAGYGFHRETAIAKISLWWLKEKTLVFVFVSGVGYQKLTFTVHKFRFFSVEDCLVDSYTDLERNQHRRTTLLHDYCRPLQRWARLGPHVCQWSTSAMCFNKQLSVQECRTLSCD